MVKISMTVEYTRLYVISYFCSLTSSSSPSLTLDEICVMIQRHLCLIWMVYTDHRMRKRHERLGQVNAIWHCKVKSVQLCSIILIVNQSKVVSLYIIPPCPPRLWHVLMKRLESRFAWSVESCQLGRRPSRWTIESYQSSVSSFLKIVFIINKFCNIWHHDIERLSLILKNSPKGEINNSIIGVCRSFMLWTKYQNDIIFLYKIDLYLF